jgi:hypothetical protein
VEVLAPAPSRCRHIRLGAEDKEDVHTSSTATPLLLLVTHALTGSRTPGCPRVIKQTIPKGREGGWHSTHSPTAPCWEDGTGPSHPISSKLDLQVEKAQICPLLLAYVLESLVVFQDYLIHASAYALLI